MEKCTLNADQLRQRQALARQYLLAKVLHVERQAQVLTIELDPGPATATVVENFISLEKQCCDFLTFNLTRTKENESLILTITGTAGTRDVLNMFESALNRNNP